jgi:hypothetical protein
MQFLRQNTATRVTVGPFIDLAGIVPEVALTATNEKITFVVDDGGVPTLVIDTNATGSGGGVNDLVHVTGDDAGYYDLELSAAQVNYVGRARLAITYATDHLPVFHEYMILTANAYDALTGADKLQVDAVEIASSTSAATSQARLANVCPEGTVNTGNVAATNSGALVFQATGLTELTADHMNGAQVIFTSGVLLYQRLRVTDYSWDAGNSELIFTCTQATEVPGDGDTFIIV